MRFNFGDKAYYKDKVVTIKGFSTVINSYDIKDESGHEATVSFDDLKPICSVCGKEMCH